MLNQRLQVLKCDICGNIVEIMHGGNGTLVCCGKDMKMFVENTTDAAKEKHVPIAKKTATVISVKVGDVAHPMEDKHYIEWIEVVSGQQVYRKYLKPGEKPEASFEVKDSASNTFTREYCNLHGLWKGDVK